MNFNPRNIRPRGLDFIDKALIILGAIWFLAALLQVLL